MPIFIKGIHVDAGKPIVCVPLVAETAEDVILQARAYVDAGVRMLEWRVDAFCDFRDESALREVLLALLEETRDTILLVTVRTKTQGGRADLTRDELFFLYDKIAQAHAADLIDVEAFAGGDVPELIKRLHTHGALVLLSHHDFKGTPETSVMQGFLSDMADMDPDVVKLAVMPENFSDTLRLMQAADAFRHQMPGMPMVVIAMGKDGALSRVTGELMGSCITFGAGEEKSAPGQLPFAEMNVALSFVHTYMGGSAS